MRASRGILRTARQAGSGAGAAAVLLACAMWVVGCSSPASVPTVPATLTSKTASSSPTFSATATSSSAATRSAEDTAASEVCGCAVGTTLTVSGSGSASNVAGKPSDAAVVSAAKTLLTKNEEAVLSNVKAVSVTRDKSGKWWALVSATEESAGAVKAVLVYDGKKWDERAYGLTITDLDLPSDVRF